jgi:hypothetical protein
MERELWGRVYRVVRSLGRSRRRKRLRFPDAAVVLAHLRAVLHDRTVAWACDPRNWAGLQPRRLLSPSTMSRRLRTDSVREFLAAAEARLRAAAAAPGGGLVPGGLVKLVDGKPLPVGGCSKDPDARRGYGAGQMPKGYKLHAVWGDGPIPLAWDVRPMNESEPAVAAGLMPRLPGGGYVLGDAVFDVNPLYEAAAAANHQLVAPRKRPHGGLGHRRHSPHRMRSIEILAGEFGRSVHRLRDDIERRFGRLTNLAGGLGPLPNWVRRLHRVPRWVQGKLILHALRLLPQPSG